MLSLCCFREQFLLDLSVSLRDQKDLYAVLYLSVVTGTVTFITPPAMCCCWIVIGRHIGKQVKTHSC